MSVISRDRNTARFPLRPRMSDNEKETLCSAAGVRSGNCSWPIGASTGASPVEAIRREQTFSAGGGGEQVHVEVAQTANIIAQIRRDEDADSLDVIIELLACQCPNYR